jgi:hypothetical protein
MRRTIACLLASLALSGAADAQPLPKELREELQIAVENRSKGLATTDAESPTVLLENLTAADSVALFLFYEALAQHPDRVDLAALRNDLQLGSLSGRSAATSIVARPSISEIFSVALESGAITRKGDDTSTTFSANALMVKQLLSGDLPRGCGVLSDDCRQGSGRWLRGLSGSATFSMAGSNVVPDEAGGIALLDNRALTAVSVRYEHFVRERRNAQAEERLAIVAADTKLATAADEFAKAAAPLQALIARTAGTWSADVVSALSAELTRPGTPDEVLQAAERILLERYRELRRRLDAAPEFAQLQTEAFAKQRAYVAVQNQLLAENLYRKTFTVDYLHERPSTQPELHQVRAVFETPLGRKPDGTRPLTPSGALVLNAGVSFFRPELAGAAAEWKIRDAQVSTALDWTPIRTGMLRPTYTIAYYFQYMVSNGVIAFDKTAITPGGAAIPLPKAASELLNTKGPIHVAQVRVSIPAASGVSFPLAVSYSNRTELVTGKAFWQGHAGISYDLAQLKQLLPRR